MSTGTVFMTSMRLGSHRQEQRQGRGISVESLVRDTDSDRVKSLLRSSPANMAHAIRESVDLGINQGIEGERSKVVALLEEQRKLRDPEQVITLALQKLRSIDSGKIEPSAGPAPAPRPASADDVTDEQIKAALAKIPKA